MEHYVSRMSVIPMNTKDAPNFRRVVFDPIVAFGDNFSSPHTPQSMGAR